MTPQELQGLASIIGRPVTPVEEMWANSLLARELAAQATAAQPPQQLADYMPTNQHKETPMSNDTHTTPTADIDPGPAPDPTPTPVIEYDLDGDGCVSWAGDGPIFAASFGLQRGDPNYNLACDFNGDGIVNGEDFNIFRKHVGEGCQ